MATAVQVMNSSASSTHQAPTTAPVLDFVCLFTHDLRRKQKRWQDGRLKYHTFNRRIMVHDDRGNFVGDAHWREDYDLDEGEELELERGGVMVQVAECIGSRDQDLSELIDKRAQEKAERQAAAMARRRPMHEPTTPSAVTPHFQLRHQPLHHLIGTPTGHHGRAAIPTESPYEERQKLAVAPQNDSARPAKRRRREVSPPSKRGYARSLFGAALTLSGAPASTPPIRTRPPRSSPILIDGEAPVSPNQEPGDSNSNTIPELARTVAAGSRKERRTNAPRTSLLKSISRTYPSRVTEPESSSFPIEIDSTPGEDRNSATSARQPGPERKEPSRRVRDIDSLQPISVNKSRSPKSRGKRDLRDDASSTASLTGKEGNMSVPTRRIKTSDRSQGCSAESKSKGVVEALNPNDGRQSIMADGSTSEPRTELRIRPRKKRGLLMVSESLNVDNLPTSRAKNRTERPRPSTSLVDSAMGDLDTIPGKGKSTDVNIGEGDGCRLKKGSTVRSFEDNGSRSSSVSRVDLYDSQDAENDDAPLIESSNKRNKRTRKRERGVPNAEDHEAAPDTSSHLILDDSSEEMVPNRKRSRASNRQTRSLSPLHEDNILSEPARSSGRRKQPPRKKKLALTRGTSGRRSEEEKSDEEQINLDEDEFPLPGSVPAPRLAHLGRKHIRSREIIGFMFDEDDYSSAPLRSEGRGEGNKRGMAQPATPAAKRMDTATTNSDRVITTDQSPGQAPANKTREAVDNTTTEAAKDRCTAASYVEPIQRDPAQKQTSLVSVPVNTELETQAQVPGTTTIMQQPPAKITVNPATRGKKAAKPSDAAGQVPQCPLPLEVAVWKPLENSRQRSRPENRPKETTTAPMPGFSRANGGPWSREAHDLLEFTRPP
ncbi:hypothetical protein F4818DRAFT_197656 [Hypoxylon cercidicola]|nr:hypothetical protein F4818DRAFT_197656 [Hypoxylon cercidicola]